MCEESFAAICFLFGLQDKLFALAGGASAIVWE